MLTALYDLGKNPPSFNVVDFLLQAERRRIALGLEKVRVRIIPGSYDGFRCDRLPPYGPEERNRWLRNIVIPMAKLLPSCGEEARMYDPQEPVPGPEWGRGEYLVGLHHNVKSAAECCYPLRAERGYVERWYPYGKFVTITLREVDWWPDRTTPLPIWTRVAKRLAKESIRVVFIRDGAVPWAPVEGFDTAPKDVSERSDARAGIYAAARTNLFIPCGPLMMAWFMGVPAIMFKPLSGHATARSWESAGIAIGRQFQNSSPGQHFVWSGDDPDFIADTTIRAVKNGRPVPSLDEQAPQQAHTIKRAVAHG